MVKPISVEKIAQLSEMIAGGNKIGAIKMYRELTGVGLAEAKTDVEKMVADLREEFPEKFPAASNSKGCLGTTAVMCLCGAIMIYSIIRM